MSKQNEQQSLVLAYKASFEPDYETHLIDRMAVPIKFSCGPFKNEFDAGEIEE